RHVDIGVRDVHRRRVINQPVHEGVEDERVVRARRNGQGQRLFGHDPNLLRASPTRVSAAKASPMRHASRSRGPTAFEMVRTSPNEPPTASAAHATPYPSIASATACGCLAMSNLAPSTVPVTVFTETTSPVRAPSSRRIKAACSSSSQSYPETPKPNW